MNYIELTNEEYKAIIESRESINEGIVDDISDKIKDIFDKPRPFSLEELEAMGIKVIKVKKSDVDKAKLSGINKDKIDNVKAIAKESVVEKLAKKYNTSPEKVKKVLTISGVLLVAVGTFSLINKLKMNSATKEDRVD